MYVFFSSKVYYSEYLLLYIQKVYYSECLLLRKLIFPKSMLFQMFTIPKCLPFQRCIIPNVCYFKGVLFQCLLFQRFIIQILCYPKSFTFIVKRGWGQGQKVWELKKKGGKIIQILMRGGGQKSLNIHSFQNSTRASRQVVLFCQRKRKFH